MKWKKMALTLYFRLYGRRCALCPKLVEVEDAHIEIRDKEYYLMHKTCKAQEKK